MNAPEKRLCERLTQAAGGRVVKPSASDALRTIARDLTRLLVQQSLEQAVLRDPAIAAARSVVIEAADVRGTACALLVRATRRATAD